MSFILRGLKGAAKRVKRVKIPRPSLRRLRRKKAVVEPRLSGKAKYIKQVEAKRVAQQRADVRQAIAKSKVPKRTKVKALKGEKVPKTKKVKAKAAAKKSRWQKFKDRFKRKKKPATAKAKPKAKAAKGGPSRLTRVGRKIKGGFKWMGRHWKALTIVGILAVAFAAIGGFGEAAQDFIQDLGEDILDGAADVIGSIFEALGVILEEIIRGILGLLANPWVLLVIGLAVAGLFLWWYFTKRHVVKVKREKAKAKEKKK